MDKIHEATKNYIKSDIPDFNSGDTVAVDVKVRERGEVTERTE